MAEKARHAFGTLERVDEALALGTIDAYDILFLKDANGKPYVGWIDRDGNKVIVQEDEEVIVVNGDSLPNVGEPGKVYIFNEDGYFWDGEKFVNLCKPTDLTALEKEIATKADAEEVEAKINEVESVLGDFENSYERIKYEITNTPKGTLVDYGEKEIRVMCPSNTQWVKQNVGATGNANMYYMAFKAYAPAGAVSFKEGDRGVIVDEMFTFDDDFAGTDDHGRNYSICWLALASYDQSSDTWTYFGKNSSTSKYIGWTYVVEWYDINGVIIGSDCIRINLSNEDCHNSMIPYYISDTTNEMKAYTDEQIASILESMTVVEF